MDFVHRSADIGKLVPAVGTLLACGSGLFLKLLIALIGRLFVAHGVRFFFFDRLFFQRSGRCEGNNLLRALATELYKDSQRAPWHLDVLR